MVRVYVRFNICKIYLQNSRISFLFFRFLFEHFFFRFTKLIFRSRKFQVNDKYHMRCKKECTIVGYIHDVWTKVSSTFVRFHEDLNFNFTFKTHAYKATKARPSTDCTQKPNIFVFFFSFVSYVFYLLTCGAGVTLSWTIWTDFRVFFFPFKFAHVVGGVGGCDCCRLLVVVVRCPVN